MIRNIVKEAGPRTSNLLSTSMKQNIDLPQQNLPYSSAWKVFRNLNKSSFKKSKGHPCSWAHIQWMQILRKYHSNWDLHSNHIMKIYTDYDKKLGRHWKQSSRSDLHNDWASHNFYHPTERRGHHDPGFNRRGAATKFQLFE